VGDNLQLRQLLFGQLDLAWVVGVEGVCQVGVAQVAQVVVVQELAAIGVVFLSIYRKRMLFWAYVYESIYDSIRIDYINQ
jgi:hypothetical protein